MTTPGLGGEAGQGDEADADRHAQVVPKKYTSARRPADEGERHRQEHDQQLSVDFLKFIRAAGK